MRGPDVARLQTLEFASPVGPWRLWIWTPAPDLRHAVACLWATEARTVAFREKIVPRETVELMVNFGGFQTLHRTGTGHAPVQFRRAWISGLQTACLEIESPTAAQLIAASLRPAHAGPLLGVAGFELADRVVPLEDVIARQAEMLAGRLEERPSIEGRFLMFENFLRDRLRRCRRAPHPAVCRAVGRLVESGGTMQARMLSGELGCSPRYLEKRVLEEVGLSPKRLARLVRFSRVIDNIRARPPAAWATVAHACGYFDQAHFNRDFRLFTGVTPTEFLASRDPSTQAMLVG